tara:strand:+ start:131 stop:292 length:162 start_codon:yes stop_codon:yes gene_type:complete
MLVLSFANKNACAAWHVDPVSLWIICNASVMDRLRPVMVGIQKHINYLWPLRI